MSVLTGEARLREQLLNDNEEYRRLANEHQSYEDQLEKLSSRPHLSEAERVQEITLKKKKLKLKDQMYSLIRKYRKEMKPGD